GRPPAAGPPVLRMGDAHLDAPGVAALSGSACSPRRSVGETVSKVMAQPSELRSGGVSGVAGYASMPSVGLDETIDFRVSLAEPGPVTVTVHRLGWCDGAGTRVVRAGETVPGHTQASPHVDPE